MENHGKSLAIFAATTITIASFLLPGIYADVGKCAALDDVNGCSTPFKMPFPYKDRFTPSCNSHDVCYRCGKMYGWSQQVCDDGFLRKMKASCSMNPTTAVPDGSMHTNSATGKLMSYVEFFQRVWGGYKKATQGGSKAEAQRIWKECKKILELFKQWMKSTDKVHSCQLGAEMYFGAVRAFGVFVYRHHKVKAFCSDTCAKQLGNPL